MTSVIDCYTGYYIETGAAAVCGIVLSDAYTKTPALEVHAAACSTTVQCRQGLVKR